MKNSVRAIIAILCAFQAVNVGGIQLQLSKNSFLCFKTYEGFKNIIYQILVDR